MDPKKVFTIILLAAIGTITCIHPIYPKDMFLQHVGTIIILGLLAWDSKKMLLSHFAFYGISIFTLFHIIGARYVYSFVPYNEWSVNFLGFDIDHYFNFTRNHYDRFVHFAFGILIFPFLVELFTRKFSLSISLAILISWLGLQTFSMFYELFEWFLTLTVSEQAADNYNGQQGDMWDAQKDMALALFGSSFMAIYYSLIRKKV